MASATTGGTTGASRGNVISPPPASKLIAAAKTAATKSSTCVGLEKMLENERQPSTGEDEASWLERIAETDVRQERLLNLHLDGAITTERFRAKSAELRETRAAADGQLEAVLSRLEDMERGKDALISHYASLMPHSTLQRR